MRWPEAVTPVRMTRVALVARVASLRDALVRVADAGVVEIDRVVAPADLPMGEAARSLQRLALTSAPQPCLAPTAPEATDLERHGCADLLAGEVELAECSAQAIVRGEVAALVGWTPTHEMPGLAARLAEVGAAAVSLPRPRGIDPPTVSGPGTARRAFAPVVNTYGTVPYADLDPTVLAGLAYAVMFGAMFGDVGHGAMLMLGAVLIRLGRLRRLARLRPHWLIIAAAGLSAALFGFAYGECFGPTGLIPAGLLSPMEQPVAMLVGGVALGALLLAGSYALGTVNRVREGGWAMALYAPSGLAGALLFVAAGLGVGAWYWHDGWVGLAAAALAAIALVLAYMGLLAGAGGGSTGAMQASIELFDLVIRLGANVVSFARLAAFGITHAVLGWIVWQATMGLWNRGAAGVVAAVAVFVVGNALAFGLEALVAGVQALRLEYYELFSRVFQLEGRPFRPWHVPMATPIATAESTKEDQTCPPGSSPPPLSSAAVVPH
jgi:V/A-type H+-transporting ATPase subunit I